MPPERFIKHIAWWEPIEEFLMQFDGRVVQFSECQRRTLLHSFIECWVTSLVISNWGQDSSPHIWWWREAERVSMATVSIAYISAKWRDLCSDSWGSQSVKQREEFYCQQMNSTGKKMYRNSCNEHRSHMKSAQVKMVCLFSNITIEHRISCLPLLLEPCERQ